MSTDFLGMNREAEQRGMRDYERGVPLNQNPYRAIYATEERDYWASGWENAAELAKQDEGK